MQIQLKTKMEIVDYRRTKASIRLDIGGGGFAISNIFIMKNSDGKDNKWKIVLPLMQINGNKRPVISLQGPMKVAIAAALSKDHQVLRASGEKSLSYSRTYQDGFAYLISETQEENCGSGPSIAKGEPT